MVEWEIGGAVGDLQECDYGAVGQNLRAVDELGVVGVGGEDGADEQNRNREDDDDGEDELKTPFTEHKESVGEFRA